MNLREQLQSKAGWWIAALVLVATGSPALLLEDQLLIASFTDDAFYYLEVARHVAKGNGFTFDGLHPTNGFQPLWLFLLVPVYWFVPGDYLPLRFLILMQSALLAVTAVLLWRILRSRISTAAAVATPLLLIGLPGARLLWIGMESSLFLGLLVLTWGVWLRVEEREPAPTRGWWFLGICCALLFLSRLEGGAALPVLLALGATRLRRAPRPGAAMAGLVAPLAVVGVAYVTWNMLAFGTLFPISGKVKMLWVGQLDFRNRVLAFIDVPWIGRHMLERVFGLAAPPPLPALLMGGLVFFSTLGVALYFRRPLLRSIREAGAGFIVLTCAVVYLFDHVVIGPYTGEWALVSLHLLTVLAIGLALARLPRLAPVALVAAILLCAARAPMQSMRATQWRQTFTGRSLVLADWIRERTPRDARVGSFYAGVLGYFAHRTVVNLDGLVNSYDYYKRVQAGDEWETYLRSERIEWLADVGCTSDTPFFGALKSMGKRIENPDCYSLAHMIRNPHLPEGCGILLWNLTWEQCPRISR